MKDSKLSHEPSNRARSESRAAVTSVLFSFEKAWRPAAAGGCSDSRRFSHPTVSWSEASSRTCYHCVRKSRSPLSPIVLCCSGFLSGKYERRLIPKGSRFDVIPGHADIYFTDQKFAIVERLRQKSTETGHSMVRLAMGWVLKKQGITSVLVGASGLGHLENAIEAMEMDFPDEWVREMDGWGANAERSD